MVHLAPGTVLALRHHQDRRTIERKNAEEFVVWAGCDLNLVFSAGAGTFIDAGSVLHALHRALRSCGLPLMQTHDLRHTDATYLLSQGTHPKIVQEMLGHSSITLTLDTYSHVVPALHQEAAGSMEALFG